MHAFLKPADDQFLEKKQMSQAVYKIKPTKVNNNISCYKLYILAKSLLRIR